MTKVFWIVAVLACPIPACAADSRPSPDMTASSAYPTFCGIPPIPTDVRSAEAFKVSVVDVRQAGRRVAEQSAPETFGLVPGQTEDFGAEARAQAAYPQSPATAAGPVDTDAFAAEARRKATPPSRPRR